MIIGFTERRKTVSEGDALSGYESFPLPMPLATLRTAEREHPMNIRLFGSSAIVEPLGGVVNQFYDATFGSRGNIDEPIEKFFVLDALDDTIPPLTAFIRDDLRPEDEECFTLRVLPADVPGRRELFTCNEDDSGAINYFCQTEICIEDDDGRFRVTCASDNNYSFQGPLLLHLWRQHIQLMRACLL